VIFSIEIEQVGKDLFLGEKSDRKHRRRPITFLNCFSVTFCAFLNVHSKN